jgi:hypothetical protein
MKLTSKPYWYIAHHLKHRNSKANAIVAASLYGINEVYGLAVTLPFVWDLLIGIIQSKIRGKHGKNKS